MIGKREDTRNFPNSRTVKRRAMLIVAYGPKIKKITHAGVVAQDREN